MSKKPYLIQFPKIGNSRTGYISVAEKETLPFVPKRIYWTYFTPEDVVRGHHAHHELEQILVAVAGKIDVEIQMPDGEKFTFLLDQPHVGVFIPKMAWRTMRYSHNAVQMCIASMEYDESDYIRNISEFKQINNEK